MYVRNDTPDALFEAWYELEMPRIFRYVCYRVRDRATAEELTAAICVEALTELHRFDPCKGEFNGWMFGLARNVVARHFRSAIRSVPTIPLESLPELRCPTRSPEEAVEMIECFREVLACLDWLSEQEQEVIALHYGAELPNRIISEVTGISEGNVRVLLHRGLKKLRAAMHAKERT